MKTKELTKRYAELALTGDEDCEPVVDSGPAGSGDEWNVSRDGKHLGCLYDDGGGYKFSRGAFAGQDYT